MKSLIAIWRWAMGTLHRPGIVRRVLSVLNPFKKAPPPPKTEYSAFEIPNHRGRRDTKPDRDLVAHRRRRRVLHRITRASRQRNRR